MPRSIEFQAVKYMSIRLNRRFVCQRCQRLVHDEYWQGGRCPYCHSVLQNGPVGQLTLVDPNDDNTEVPYSLAEWITFPQEARRSEREVETQTAESEAVREIATWMAKELRECGRLDHKAVIRHIQATAGIALLYRNENGNWAIHPRVLNHFSEIMNGTKTWDRDLRRWTLCREQQRPTVPSPELKKPLAPAPLDQEQLSRRVSTLPNSKSKIAYLKTVRHRSNDLEVRALCTEWIRTISAD